MQLDLKELPVGGVLTDGRLDNVLLQQSFQLLQSHTFQGVACPRPLPHWAA